ncbi:c(7)-type cytochrome triheme domain-containing protein [Inmirania thermothiophila]|uniref:C(7)-type cytochrome triheme protein n=1 Tax=Inmirania thermothiophila TaxID=1750597 RepID=A0A3N1Y278_9GAMM|nr:c(7)-type cytochrome triheme domain-containing protein [Inmirania thermothiophila]ROR32919.1 c(7)-type cytochrome triheme protein [Inmirania thermothiophila]
MRRLRLFVLAVAALGLAGPAAAATGKEVVDTICAGCHRAGVLGAPRLGKAQDWKERLQQGRKTLYEHALKGFKAMPAKGGNPKLTDAEVRAAVDHMLSLAEADKGGAAGGGEAAAAKEATAAAPAPRAAPKPRVSAVNRFNRLLEKEADCNPPPPEDGIHDPENDGTHLLLPPKEAFTDLPKAPSGNCVDWVKALEDGYINPRYDRLDPNVQPIVMDLNIVREVKGSMPDVVYPHKQHTEWLDCSNCHPAIFVPQKGANQISMAAILLGQKCGACHGKVSFPVKDCRKCHSKKKPMTLQRTQTTQ